MERRVLLQDVQRQTDRAAVPEPKRTCEDRSGAGEPGAVRGTVQEKEGGSTIIDNCRQLGCRHRMSELYGLHGLNGCR